MTCQFHLPLSFTNQTANFYFTKLKSNALPYFHYKHDHEEIYLDVNVIAPTQV